jgi:hypothetical protein
MKIKSTVCKDRNKNEIEEKRVLLCDAIVIARRQEVIMILEH